MFNLGNYNNTLVKSLVKKGVNKFEEEINIKTETDNESNKIKLLVQQN